MNIPNYSVFRDSVILIAVRMASKFMEWEERLSNTMPKEFTGEISQVTNLPEVDEIAVTCPHLEAIIVDEAMLTNLNFWIPQFLQELEQKFEESSRKPRVFFVGLSHWRIWAKKMGTIGRYSGKVEFLDPNSIEMAWDYIQANHKAVAA